MTRTLRSEWTKVLTQRGTLVAAATMCVLMVGLTAFFASESEADAAAASPARTVSWGTPPRPRSQRHPTGPPARVR